MPAYIVALLKVHDPDKYREYAAKFAATLEPYDGRLLVAADSAEVLEGEPPYPRTVVGEFASVDEARRWYYSDAYQVIVPLRTAASDGSIYIIEGLSVPKRTEN